MSIKAKFPGFCPLCHIRFVVGQDDIENRQGKWVHVACPTHQKASAPVVSDSSVKPFHYNSIQPKTLHAEKNESFFDNLNSAISAPVVEVSEQHEEKVFTPSVYQKAVYEWLKEAVENIFNTRVSNHLVIEAVAGSGKTTTIVQALKIIPDTFEVAFIAFNKHIANELKKRAPAGVYVSTLHSLGLQVVRNNVGNVKVEPEKLGDILNDFYPVDRKKAIDNPSDEERKRGFISKTERKENFAKRAGMRNVVAIVKNTLTDEKDLNAVSSLLDKYGIEVDEKYIDEILELLPTIVQRSEDQTNIVDFDDMIWLPVRKNMSFIKFDFFFGDEWQDMNACQLEFAERSLSDNGHLIAVGDRYQSLYGFRGADVDAIPNTIKRFNADTLPLSVTYRCPASHVNLAKEIVPQLEARENAPEGEVKNINYFDLVKQLEPGDMVICRTNAPLVKPAFQCIRAGKKAIIRGKDIGSSLVNLVKRFETNDLGQFEINLAEYFEKELEKLMNKGKEMQALLLIDRVETLRFIMNECETVSELIAKIDLLFDDNNIGIVFSSVHRAKGLEAERVYILRPEIMPHPKAKKPWEQDQEMNAKYVAQTRSKDKLYMVIGGEDI